MSAAVTTFIKQMRMDRMDTGSCAGNSQRWETQWEAPPPPPPARLPDECERHEMEGPDNHVENSEPRLEEFFKLNHLDLGTQNKMRELPPDTQRRIMDAGFDLSYASSASAVVWSRIKREEKPRGASSSRNQRSVDTKRRTFLQSAAAEPRRIRG